MPRLLDLFAGRFGWSRAFAARGWECVGVDLVEPPEIPRGCAFVKADVLGVGFNDLLWKRKQRRVCELYGGQDGYEILGEFDFICASSPCEQFSVHGMKHFHPNPPYPELGIRLFEHTRALCEASGVPWVMENVRAAQQFVGNAVHHCGPFYLWGSGVPPLMNQGITKGNRQGSGGCAKLLGPEELRLYRKQYEALQVASRSKARKEMTAKWATIPPELANCVADFAERIVAVAGT